MSLDLKRHLHILNTLGTSSQSLKEPGAIFIILFMDGKTTDDEALGAHGPSLITLDPHHNSGLNAGVMSAF